ncbi:MAG: hypothetical protein WCX61_00790 [Candidatus Peribacteraceae bacterium]|jgi:hypothetical protein
MVTDAISSIKNSPAEAYLAQLSHINELRTEAIREQIEKYQGIIKVAVQKMLEEATSESHPAKDIDLENMDMTTHALTNLTHRDNNSASHLRNIITEAAVGLHEAVANQRIGAQQRTRETDMDRVGQLYEEIQSQIRNGGTGLTLHPTEMHRLLHKITPEQNAENNRLNALFQALQEGYVLLHRSSEGEESSDMHQFQIARVTPHHVPVCLEYKPYFGDNDKNGIRPPSIFRVQKVTERKWGRRQYAPLFTSEHPNNYPQVLNVFDKEITEWIYRKFSRGGKRHGILNEPGVQVLTENGNLEWQSLLDPTLEAYQLQGRLLPAGKWEDYIAASSRGQNVFGEPVCKD